MDEQDRFDQEVKIVIAWRFYHESLAHLYQSKLKQVGIHSFLSNHLTSNLIPFGDGGILLHVKQSDLEASQKVIEETYDLFKQRAETDHKEADLDDIEYEKMVHLREERITNAKNFSFKSSVLFVVLGLILAILISYLTSH